MCHKNTLAISLLSLDIFIIFTPRMAQLLYNKVKDIPQLKVMYPVQANGVFVQLPRQIWTELQKHYFFYDWDLDNDVVRWLCSFDTTEEDVEMFVEKLKSIL